MTWAGVRDVLHSVYRSKPVRTFAQTLSALLSVAVVGGASLDEIKWVSVLSTAALAGLYALVQAIADGSPLVGPPTPPSPPQDETGGEDAAHAE